MKCSLRSFVVILLLSNSIVIPMDNVTMKFQEICCEEKLIERDEDSIATAMTTF
jgi:hypothetical protein